MISLPIHPTYPPDEYGPYGWIGGNHGYMVLRRGNKLISRAIPTMQTDTPTPGTGAFFDSMGVSDIYMVPPPYRELTHMNNIRQLREAPKKPFSRKCK